MTSTRHPRLALDMFVLGQGVKSGVYRVCDELFPRLALRADFRLRYVLPSQYSAAAMEYVETRKLPGFLHSAPIGLPSADADILLSPFNAPSTQWAQDQQVLHAQIVYDLIAINHPEYFSAAAVAEVRDIMDRITPETVVFAISLHTKKDFLAYRPDLSPDQVTVIPLAAGQHFSVCNDVRQRAATRAAYGIPAGVPYVLSLATLEIRKNLELVVRAFVQLLNVSPESDVRLVLAGMSGWKLEKLEAELRVAGKWRDRIIITGFVEDSALPILYSDALCFVYMSRYEGFGLPPLEAMSCGLPVICSDNSSLPEVVGDAGIKLDADDTHGLARAMERILKNPELREALSAQGLERAKLFTWEQCSQIVADTLSAAYVRRWSSSGKAKSSGQRAVANVSLRLAVSRTLGGFLVQGVPVLRWRSLCGFGGGLLAITAWYFWTTPRGGIDFWAGACAGAFAAILGALGIKKIRASDSL